MLKNGQHCAFVKYSGMKPFKRCAYCNRTLSNCFGFQFFFITVGMVSLLILMYTIRDLPGLAIDISILILLMLALLGFIADKETNEIILDKHMLEELNSELEARVFQRTKELHVLTLELEKTLRIKTDFFGNLSHGLFTPLTAIVGYCDILLQKNTGEVNDNQLKAISSIKRNSSDLGDRIRELIELSRAESSKVEVDDKWFDLSKIISEATVNMEPLASKNDIVLNTQMSAHKLMAFSNPEAIKIVLMNLIGNAIKASSAGNQVRIVTEDKVDEIVVFVKDEGHGIEEERLTTIFEESGRVAHIGKDGHSNMKIGLSIVKNLVEAHGGSVWAESTLGKGSSFFFSIPKKNK